MEITNATLRFFIAVTLIVIALGSGYLTWQLFGVNGVWGGLEIPMIIFGGVTLGLGWAGIAIGLGGKNKTDE